MIFFKKTLFFIIFIINFKNNYCQFLNVDKKILEIINPLVDNKLNIEKGYIGIVVGIVKNNNDNFYSFGSMNINKVEKPKRDTIFEIGSITKTFTSILLADSYVNNIVNLNDNYNICKNNYTNSTCFNGTPINLINLSTHTSGLPRLPSNLNNSLNPYGNYYYKNLNDFLSTYKLEYKPGIKYEYSNLGAGILGSYLEKRENKSYQNLIKDKISNPFNLKDTTIELTQNQKKRFAHGYYLREEVPHWDMNDKSVLSSASALRSTTNDMLIYIKNQMKTKLNKSIYKAISLTHIERFKINQNLSVGLGWHIDTLNNITWHNGETYGFTSYIGFDKKTKTGVIIMANSFLGINNTKIDESGIKIMNILRS